MFRNPDTPRQESSGAERPSARGRFADLAARIPFDRRNPPKPSRLPAPAAGNVFEAEDEPTLAGRVAVSLVYDRLIARPDAPKRDPQEVIAAGKKALGAFEAQVEAWNRVAKKYGTKTFFLDVRRPPGATGFHLDGETAVTRPHLFFFNKSTREWKDPSARLVRAYVTLDPEDADAIAEHFTNLCAVLHRAGVDFTAKGASPNGAASRTDNAVFYIAEGDRETAEKEIRGYLRSNGIGRGHVEAAEPDESQDGLSWAPEPDAADVEYWQAVSGSSRPGSYNAVVAARIVPDVLDRLAAAHREAGDTASADAFAREAARVRALRERYEKGKGA